VNKLATPHDAMIFVGDGRKALFLRNDGDEKFPNLKTEQVFADENPIRLVVENTRSFEWISLPRREPRRARETSIQVVVRRQ
jgi:protein required for attachment to host cells